MSENTGWPQKSIEKWKEQAEDYPTKALFETAQQVYEEQSNRLESQKAKLDGMMWSPEGWE